MRCARTLAVSSLASLLVSGALLTGARAQTLIGYNFDNGAASTLNATTTNSNVAASAIATSGASIVSGTNLNNSLGYGTGYVYQFVVNSAATTTPSLAVTNNSYFQFTITPNAGTSVSLTGLSFDAGRGGTGSPRGYEVRSSIDGFTADLGDAAVSTVRPTFSNYTTTFSFTGITTATTFRIYTYVAASGQSVEYDNVTLLGTTGAASPEPPAIAFAALPLLAGAGGALVRRRRVK